MNSQGYTKDNIHKGNTKIVAGGIDVDGLIRIGDQSAGGDGYILPSVKGTEGQVLTMNADNTSSFEDVGGGTTGRIIKNLFTMIDREASFGATPSNTYLDGFGNLNLGSIDNFPVGATIHLYTKGTWQTSGNGTSNFVFIINDGSPQTITINSQTITAIANNDSRFFYNDLILQRTDINEYKFKATGLTSTGSSGDPAVSIFWPASTFTPVPDLTTLSLRFAYKTNDNTFYPLTTTLIVDMILDSSLLIDPPPAPTSHLALTDLNAGDSGHTQFALLQGRSGGQLLSGGINASHFLTLKAHRFGLNNIVVKDLNTTFEKNIDMNQNQINDVSLITNTTAPLGFVGSSGTSAMVLDPDPSNSFNVLGQSDIKLQSNTDVILQSSTGFVDLNSNITRVNVGGIPKLQVDASETTSSNNINMGDNEIQNVGKITSSADLTLTPSNNVVCSTDLDMSNNSLLNGFGLNTQFLLASSQIETSQIISVGLGQQNYVANPHIFTADGTPATQQLEINNVELSAFKPLNMNNGGINNVSSINGITPVGGLYASTSAGILINNTTLTSLTPSSSVGSLSVPPNIFNVGDCFHLVITGDCVFTNNDEIQITLKQNGNILAQTPIFSLEDANGGNNVFEIEADFNIRSIGATGSIHTSFEFTYNKDSLDSKDFRGTRSNDTQPINTTIVSALDVEFQFITKNASSSIQTQLFRLQKVF